MKPFLNSQEAAQLFDKHIKKLIALVFVFCFQQSLQAQFTHPGVQFTTEDLDRMRNNINVEPWRTGYRLMLEERTSSLNYQMQGPFEVVARNGENFRAYNDDMDAVFYQSIQWYITGNDRYAENAIEIIEAWTTTQRVLNGNVPSISVADKGVKMLTGAEVLRYNYSGWTNRLTRITEAYTRDVLLPPLYVPDATRIANQGAGQINGALSLAVYMDDQELFDQAIDAFLNESCAGITNSLPNGQNGDTGRDYGHAFGVVINLAAAAEQAHKQGVDLFSVLDNRVLAITEYWNAYGLGVDVPFIPYGTCYDYFETIGSRGRGFSDFNTNMLLEIVDGAYNVRKGIRNPFTTQRINEIPVSRNTFLFKKDVDRSRSANPGEPNAAHTGVTDNQLTDIRIGNGNSNGSSSFNRNRNTWTVTGNGDVFGVRGDDACQYAYTSTNSSATIIARVSNINSSNSNAKVGLMFRESLDSDSDMFALYAHNEGGIETTWRGQTITYTQDRSPDGFNNNNSNGFQSVPNSGWIKIVVNDNRVTGFYSVDNVVWVPVTSANFDRRGEYHLGLFAGSNGSPTATGTFTNVEVFTKETANPIDAGGVSFIPNENRTYYIDSPRHNLRIGSTGSREEPFTTSLNTTGANVEWKFVSNGNGGWYIDRADGGSLPRLRSDRTELADMQSTEFDGRWETFGFMRGSTDDTHFISLPQGPDGFSRLQVDSSGNINMVPITSNGSWESFRITEAGFISGNGNTIVQITKRNAPDFAIDGGFGGSNGQNVILSAANSSDDGQLWLEIDRGNGFYSYEKLGTNFSLDGNRGGVNNQAVHLWQTQANNQNQHWQKQAQGDGSFRLIKRNATGFTINGSSGGREGRNITLFDSGVNSQNLQWFVTPVSGTRNNKDTQIITQETDVLIYPNPVVSTTTIENAADSTIIIYDMNGIAVYTKSITRDSEVIDLSGLASGLYYTEINEGNKLSVVKLVKQ